MLDTLNIIYVSFYSQNILSNWFGGFGAPIHFENYKSVLPHEPANSVSNPKKYFVNPLGKIKSFQSRFLNFKYNFSNS